MPDTVSHTPFVGQRIKLHGHKGSIKFIGEVDGTSGVWLGIEWDDPKRGKHSGEKDGRKYFDCKYAKIPKIYRYETNRRRGRTDQFLMQ